MSIRLWIAQRCVPFASGADLDNANAMLDAALAAERAAGASEERRKLDDALRAIESAFILNRNMVGFVDMLRRVIDDPVAVAQMFEDGRRTEQAHPANVAEVKRRRITAPQPEPAQAETEETK